MQDNPDGLVKNLSAALGVILRHAFRPCQESAMYLGGNLKMVFYTREGFHLCDEFEALLQASLNCRGLHYQRIDVDKNPALKERFGKRVPVLEINGEVAAEGRSSPAAMEGCIEAFLKKIS